MSLNPLRRTEQSGFFAVPRAVDDGALRAPSLLVQFAQHARLFEHTRHAGKGIVGASAPAIKVIPANPPLVWTLGAAHGCDDIVDRLCVPVRSNFEMDFRRPRADVISNRQRAAPFFRSDGTRQRGEKRQSVSP